MGDVIRHSMSSVNSILVLNYSCDYVIFSFFLISLSVNLRFSEY